MLDTFISHSRSNAERICMVDTNGQRRITSGQFVRMVDSHIHLLRSQGIQEGDVVAIRLDRKAEHIAAFIACMSMGCSFVTIGIDSMNPGDKRRQRVRGPHYPFPYRHNKQFICPAVHDRLMRYKAVGFDLDGTLVNTHVDYTDLNSVNDYILRPMGFPVDEIWEDRDRTSRQPLYEWLRNHGRASEISQLDKLLDDRCLSIEKLGAEGSSLYNGIVDTLRWLKDSGVKLGLVTRGGHEYAILLLSEYGLLEFFDVIQGRDDFGYQDAKPSPKAMYHLADALGVDPSEMLYVGDSPTDYMSARDANVDYAGVMTGRGSVELWSTMDPKIHIIPSAADVRSLM